jgi:hypothetical protein
MKWEEHVIAICVVVWGEQNETEVFVLEDKKWGSAELWKYDIDMESYVTVIAVRSLLQDKGEYTIFTLFYIDR